MKQDRVLAILLLVLVSVPGCSRLFPRSHVEVVSSWQSFEAAKGAFDAIEPGRTSILRLAETGFNPLTAPNLRILNHLEITRVFLPNPSITLADIEASVRDCLALRDACHAYSLDLNFVDRERYGNLWLDIFGFRRNARESGWTFSALIVMDADKVIHKQWSGQPIIERIETRETPLGPIQEVDLGSAFRSLIR